ncbi:hypothetical protein SAMN04487950_3358 [Halogranum rubrum]|uniref:Uncharacterized protein n=1 Tax=Halogranum rubrum TaxID=553466 RepID=A0A1I4GQU0_9EURY|nr:hypothetical protein SAMN04487950_3358 [Halogranum rubrum]
MGTLFRVFLLNFFRANHNQDGTLGSVGVTVETGAYSHFEATKL